MHRYTAILYLSWILTIANLWPSSGRVFATGEPATPIARPGLVCEPATLDLGSLEANTKTSFQGTIRNIGSMPVNILALQSTCSCTNVKTDRMRIEPGAAALLEGVFDPAGLRGKVLREIHITTDDPVRPMLSIAIRAEVNSDLLILPESVMFKNIEQDAGSSATVTVEMRLPRAVEARGLRIFGPPFVTGEIMRRTTGPITDKQGRDLVLTRFLLGLRIAPGADPGVFVGSAQLATDAPKHPTVVITFNGTIQGDLVLDRPQVFFLRIAPGQPTTRTIELTSRRGVPFKVTGIDGGPLPLGPWSAAPLNDKAGWRITLEWPGDDAPNTVGTITIKTDHPNQPSLPVPAVFSTRRRASGAGALAPSAGPRATRNEVPAAVPGPMP